MTKDIDTPLIAFLAAQVDMPQQTEEVQKGIKEAVGRAFMRLARNTFTDNYRFPEEVTPRMVLKEARAIVDEIHSRSSGTHAEYLASIGLALKGALED